MRTPFLPVSCAFALLLGGCFMPASIDNRLMQRDMERIRAEAAVEWRRLDAEAASRGWQPVGEPREGGLEERYNESDEIAITLPATGEYNVVGICSANCVDMDLVVYNAARQRVAGDLEPDAVPIAAFRGSAGERFTVRVTIPDCRRPPRNPQLNEEPMWRCIYWTRVYRR